jgi:hypothetical protein
MVIVLPASDKRCSEWARSQPSSALHFHIPPPPVPLPFALYCLRRSCCSEPTGVGDLENGGRIGRRHPNVAVQIHTHRRGVRADVAFRARHHTDLAL